jgi:hypothetical protein
MFRAKLTISKVAQVKRPACWPGVFVCGLRIGKAAPVNEKSGVTEGFLAMCHQQGGMLAGIF